MNKPSLVIPSAILLGGAIVALAIYFSEHRSEPSTRGGGDPALIAPVASGDHIYGNPAAPIKIIEYADFDCEFCAQFDDTMRQVMSQYGAGGEVAWVFRDFPIAQLHPDAYRAAEAADCVAATAGNDAYWRFASALFAGQPVDPKRYLALAQAAGADPSAVGACEQSASSSVDAQIDADIANAQAIGALGTPYAILEAPSQPLVVIDGAWPYAALAAQIDQELTAIKGE
ncbi:MAG TPA: thioredoxin domain-containing protein [Candidatus Paceibacterota bacterium]|nr:thioredoxin domain-containing protein [Candidatus Paceibacterota bacterium]